MQAFISRETTDTRGDTHGRRCGNIYCRCIGSHYRRAACSERSRHVGFFGSEIALKANYNSADPPPASTHIDTLDALCTAILAEKPKKLTLAERSGMGNTRSVLEECGVIELAQKRGFSAVVLDELDRTGWREIQAPGLHWSRGFFIASIFARADRVVQTCCLKTHRFGGHFTMSLKNSVGLIAKRVPGGQL